MKYLCLVYLEGGQTPAAEALKDASLDYDDVLRARGQFVGAHALEPPAQARVVRLRGGKLSMTDGPFAETKEQLAGFILVEARDLNEALQIAAGIPIAAVGAIEVRATRDPFERPWHEAPRG